MRLNGDLRRATETELMLTGKITHTHNFIHQRMADAKYRYKC